VHPYLFEKWLGPWALIPSYAFFLAFAYFVAYLDAIRRTIAAGLEPRHLEVAFFLVLVSSFLGGHFFHLAFEPSGFAQKGFSAFWEVWNGGLVLYGGIAVSLVALWGYFRWKTIDALPYFDVIAPSTLLGIAMGRVGCFLAGCCWGTPSSLPWAVTYWHRQSLAALRSVSLHPTQLYESLVCLLLLLFVPYVRSRGKEKGNVFRFCLGAYATTRFFLEYFRADTERGFVLGSWLSVSQCLSLLILLVLSMRSALNRFKLTASR
jgi:phosphatidylglycerol---prolipoprotein diacylglyceryl transferase